MKNVTIKLLRPVGLYLPLVLATLASPIVCAGTVAQSPLFLTQPVKPNIMLMLDNSGSMSNIVPEAPYDPKQTYACPSGSGTAIDPSKSVDIHISGGIPDKNCFKPNETYTARLVASKNKTDPGNYIGSSYSGNYLNWYFDASTTAGSWTAGVNGQKPGTFSRMEIAQNSAKSLVDSLDYVRLGLSAYYNSEDGGALLETIEDIDEVTSKKANIKQKIDDLLPENNTPLAETLSDIGHYFTTGFTGNLTLHPGKANKSTASVDAVFAQASNDGLYNSSGQKIVSPIQYSCQKSFAVLMTDGRPNLDRDISKEIRDYTGDCASGLCDAGPTDTNPSIPPGPLTSLFHADGKTKIGNGAKKGNSYEWGGSDYLDDVAQALFEMDLRPDITKSKAGEINNLITYAIGFADPALTNDKLLPDAARLGGGQFILAENSTELNEAFQKIIADIGNQSQEASASALGSNSTRLDTSTRIYQAGFNSKDWTGTLKAFALTTVSEDTNSNGVLDTGEDTNKNKVLDGAGTVIEPAKWVAENLIPSDTSRRILSYNPLATTSSKGVSFEWAYLNNTQKAVLDPATSATAASSPVLSYLRGDQSKEQTVGPYRKRENVLGDIVNSDPLTVTNSEDFGYSIFSGTEGDSYSTFRTDKSARPNVIYVGANDGMLHAFDAETGVELFAYVPNAVIPALSKLTNPKYGCRETGCVPHEYFVDGAPKAGDAYFAVGTGTASWRTLLLGTTGAGSGKAVFALDVTNPNPTKSTSASEISTDKVLWEISPNQAPVSADLTDTTSTPTKLGFTKNLGYTIPQPALVRMQNGSWAVIVANGYNSTNNKAVLFILNAATGAIIRSIDTGKGSSTAPNGLSTPIPVDTNGDRIVDYIYAGDLLGNLWKFDVSNTDTSKWAVAFGTSTSPAPLFTACSAACTATNFQPITAKPQVGRHPSGGLMIYFGTGKYYESGDQIVGTTPAVQSFYGVWDNGSVVSGRSSLQEQQILAEASLDINADKVNDIDLRATTNTSVDYVGNASVSPPVVAKRGWFMDLITPVNNKKGERIVSQALLRGGRIFFLTLIPTSDACSSGGTSWFMELDAVSGKRLVDIPFDTDNNGLLNVADQRKLVDTNADGKTDTNDESVVVSGRKLSDGGITKSKTVLSDGESEQKISNDSKNKIENFKESKGEPTGRQSWRQIR